MLEVKGCCAGGKVVGDGHHREPHGAREDWTLLLQKVMHDNQGVVCPALFMRLHCEGDVITSGS